MCDKVKGNGVVCDKPVKADGRCGIHKKTNDANDAVLDPVDAIATGVAAINTHEEEHDETTDESDAGCDAPHAGAGKAGKTKEEKAAEAAALIIYKTKPLAEMTPAEKDATITFLRDFHSHTLKKRAEAQKKTREKNIEKGLTGSGKKKVTPWEAAYNRERGQGLGTGDTEEEWEAKKPRKMANLLAKHVEKCDGSCGFAHV